MRSIVVTWQRRRDMRLQARITAMRGTWHPFAVHVGAILSDVIVADADVTLVVDRVYAPVSLHLVGAPRTSLWSPAGVVGGRLVDVERFPAGGVRVTVAPADGGAAQIVTAAAARWAN